MPEIPEEIRERLEAAEQLCLMFSWTAPSEFTRDGKACFQLYRRWLQVSGVDPERDKHPELDEVRLNDLTAEYDGKQTWTLRGDPDDHKVLGGAGPGLQAGIAACPSPGDCDTQAW